MSDWSNYPTVVQAVCRHDRVILSSSTRKLAASSRWPSQADAAGVAPVELRLDRIHCPKCGLVLWQRDKPDDER